MKRTIWKVTLEVIDMQIIELPEGAEILTVQTQNDKPYLWAVVDPEKGKHERTIYVFGTGNPIPDDAMKYIGTFQLKVGFVGHVFEGI